MPGLSVSTRAARRPHELDSRQVSATMDVCDGELDVHVRATAEVRTRFGEWHRASMPRDAGSVSAGP